MVEERMETELRGMLKEEASKSMNDPHWTEIKGQSKSTWEISQTVEVILWRIQRGESLRKYI